VTKSAEALERLQARLDAAMPDKFPEVIVRTFPLELGPPVGWPPRIPANLGVFIKNGEISV
jgi:multidrug efflux pump